MSRPGYRGRSTGAASRRLLFIVGGVLLVIVAAIAIGEATGWPFLVGPLQRTLSERLDRRIVVSGGEDGSTRVRLGFIGSVRVKAPTLEVGAPSWSKAPHMILAHNAALKLRYIDLWRAYRGAPLRVAELRADDLDAQVERLADGRASWQFGAPKPSEPGHESGLPSFGEFQIADGKLLLRDAVLEADLDASFSLTERSATGPGAGASRVASSSSTASSSTSASTKTTPPSDAGALASASSPVRAASGAAVGNGEAGGLSLHAGGRYRKLPLKIDLTTNGVLALAGPDASKITQPVTLDATIGRARVRFDGLADDVLHLGGLRGRFNVEGPSLAAVGDPLGVTLPTTGNFKTHGFLSKDGALWKAVFEQAAVGSSSLRGSFTFDRSQPLPLLAGRLTGTRLILADLGPAVGHVPPSKPVATAVVDGAKPHKVLPDRRFDLPSLRAMNANVLIDIPYLDLGTPLLEPLKPLRTHLRLQGGVLSLSDIEARSAEGRLIGDLQLDGRQPQAIWNVDLRLFGVRLERWLHQTRGGGAPPYLSGQIDGQVKVSGAGRSTAEILGSLDGAMRFHLRDAALSHIAVEAAGIDLAQALGVFIKGDDALPINCNVIDFSVQKGLAKPKMFVLDTKDSTIWVDGSLSLQQESLDLTAVVSPKDFSPLTLRTPIHVKGTFSSPSVSLEKGKLGAKVGAAALLSLLNPLAAIIPFIDPGAREDAQRDAAQCAALAKRSGFSKGESEKPAAGRTKGKS